MLAQIFAWRLNTRKQLDDAKGKATHPSQVGRELALHQPFKSTAQEIKAFVGMMLFWCTKADKIIPLVRIPDLTKLQVKELRDFGLLGEEFNRLVNLFLDLDELTQHEVAEYNVAFQYLKQLVGFFQAWPTSMPHQAGLNPGAKANLPALQDGMVFVVGFGSIPDMLPLELNPGMVQKNDGNARYATPPQALFNAQEKNNSLADGNENSVLPIPASHLTASSYRAATTDASGSRAVTGRENGTSTGQNLSSNRPGGRNVQGFSMVYGPAAVSMQASQPSAPSSGAATANVSGSGAVTGTENSMNARQQPSSSHPGSRNVQGFSMVYDPSAASTQASQPSLPSFSAAATSRPGGRNVQGFSIVYDPAAASVQASQATAPSSTTNASGSNVSSSRPGGRNVQGFSMMYDPAAAQAAAMPSQHQSQSGQPLHTPTMADGTTRSGHGQRISSDDAAQQDPTMTSFTWADFTDAKQKDYYKKQMEAGPFTEGSAKWERCIDRFSHNINAAVTKLNETIILSDKPIRRPERCRAFGSFTNMWLHFADWLRNYNDNAPLNMAMIPKRNANNAPGRIFRRSAPEEFAYWQLQSNLRNHHSARTPGSNVHRLLQAWDAVDRLKDS